MPEHPVDESTSAKTPKARARVDSLRLVTAYAIVATLWILTSDWFVRALPFDIRTRALIESGKGVAFVAVTASMAYFISHGHLSRLYAAQSDYARAQQDLRRRDRAIQQAYIDVLDAVTGGKLILMTPVDINAALGQALLPMESVPGPESLSAQRARIADAVRPLSEAVDDMILASAEALTNALKHGTEARCGVYRSTCCIQIVVEDHGPGIDFHTLPRATLVAGFSTASSLGMGFSIMLELTDRLLLATEPGLTRLVLEFDVDSAETSNQDDLSRVLSR